MTTRWPSLRGTKSTEVRVRVTGPDGEQSFSDESVKEVLERFLSGRSEGELEKVRDAPHIWVKVESVPPDQAQVSGIRERDSRGLVATDVYMLIWHRRLRRMRIHWEWEIQSTRHIGHESKSSSAPDILSYVLVSGKHLGVSNRGSRSELSSADGC